MERNRVVKGPRANNYGVDSNVPPDNPTKKVDLLDVEDLEVRVPWVLHCKLHCKFQPAVCSWSREGQEQRLSCATF